MLVRVRLHHQDPALRRRILKLGAAPNVLIEESDTAATLDSDGCDVFLVGAEELDDPIPDVVANLRGEEGVEVIALAGPDDLVRSAELIAGGCLSVVRADDSGNSLRASLLASIEKHREVLIERVKLEQVSPGSTFNDFASRSPSMQPFLSMARRVAGYDSSLLILGETGCGKEYLARAIHNESHRSGGPFIVVNCGALPEALLESVLFGHEKGAFTGAVRDHRGYFELAHRGTIFLDEIGEMTPHMQVRLLGVLQDRQIQRLGGEDVVAVDVRVMAATNRDVKDEIINKRFREDLYYRLSVVTLSVPPLRDRKEDIPDLVDRNVVRFRQKMGKPGRGLEPTALRALEAYHWPGNIRELINVVERAVLLSTGDAITASDLPEQVLDALPAETNEDDRSRRGPPLTEHDQAWFELPLVEAKRVWTEGFERAYLIHHLTSTGGRVALAAQQSGIDRRSMYAKMRRYGLSKEEFKSRS